MKPRLIIDTNVVLSYHVRPGSTIKRAMEKAILNGKILHSQATFDEYRHTLARFVRKEIIAASDATELLAAMFAMSEWVPIIETVRACRDPGDDKFLELAVNGQAAYLITGDADLLALHPFRGTAILSPADFLQH